MSANRTWKIGTALLAVVIVALGWFLGISPRLTEVSAANAQRVTAEGTNAAHQAEINALKARFDEVDGIRDQLEQLSGGIPATAELDAFVLQVDQGLSATGSALKSFGVGEGSLLTAAVDPAAATDADPAAAPTTGGLIGIPVNFEVEGSFDGVLAFVNGLQTSTRLVLVSSLGIVASTENPGLFVGTISGYLFVMLDPDATTGEVEPVEEAAETPTPDPAASETPLPTDSATPAP